VKALAERGDGVDFYGSTTRYNGEFLEAMRRLPGVQVRARAISSSVAARWRGAWAYVSLLATLLWSARRYATVNLQFSGFWPVELVVFGSAAAQVRLHRSQRRATRLCVDAAPRRRGGSRAWRARSCSSATRRATTSCAATASRSGTKASVLPHGLLPVAAASKASTGYSADQRKPKLAGVLEHGQALQGRRTVRRAGARERDPAARLCRSRSTVRGPMSCTACAMSWSARV
jgi:hypothetical protein